MLLYLLGRRCHDNSFVTLRTNQTQFAISYDSRLRVGRPIHERVGDEELVRALLITYLIDDIGYEPCELIAEYAVPVYVGHTTSTKYVDLAVVDGDIVKCLIELKSPQTANGSWNAAWRGQLWGLANFIHPRPQFLAYGSARSDNGAIELRTADSHQFANYNHWAAEGTPHTYTEFGYDSEGDPTIKADNQILISKFTPPPKDDIKLNSKGWLRGSKRTGTLTNALPDGHWKRQQEKWYLRLTFTHDNVAAKDEICPVDVRYRQKPDKIEEVRVLTEPEQQGDKFYAWGRPIKR